MHFLENLSLPDALTFSSSGGETADGKAAWVTRRR
jgi:hypothetical protein